MYARKNKWIICIYLAVFLMAGCVSTPGPKGWLPTPKQALSDAFGAWMIVEHGTLGRTKIAEGEFIAVQKLRVYILPQYGEDIESIPINTINKVTLAVYREHSYAGLWTLLGSLSTISHGYFLVASFPIWLLGGALNTAAESSSGIEELIVFNWQDLSKYARFPQGIPNGLDLEALKPKSKEDKKII